VASFIASKSACKVFTMLFKALEDSTSQTSTAPATSGNVNDFWTQTLLPDTSPDLTPQVKPCPQNQVLHYSNIHAAITGVLHMSGTGKF
jgi:hypothetical protein